MIYPSVSIIVPVYNTEKYLHRCLDSILAQTFSDFELLLVDDGSPDRSGEICDEYAKKDSRIRVFHQENKGVAAARQVGMDNACGEYSIHADPDDWVEPNMLEEMYGKAKEEDADVVMCDFKRIYADHQYDFIQRPTTLKCDDIIEDLICERIWGSTCNKLVRCSLFKEYKIRFVPTMNLQEDLYITCALLQHSIKVSYINQSLYNYDCDSNENSIVRFRTVSHLQSMMRFIDDFSPIFDEPRYEDGWYMRKCNLKRCIYRLNPLEYNIRKTYSDINDRYIAENVNAKIGTEPFYISLCLKGFPIRVVYTLQYLVGVLANLKNRLLTKFAK